MITILDKKSDELGMLSSTLCMLHCMATPFLLLAVPSSQVTHHGSQAWWSWLDILFLGISLIAVFMTVQQSTQKWLKVSLVVSWLMLSFFILNERFEGIEFSFDMVYFPAFALVVLHLVNKRQCRCENDQPGNEAWMIDSEKKGVK
ncbi:MAG: MerC domain-containing protein [Cytophagales bacterium]|nr:MerC domain-containing protein [Cytophagales bacterium]